MEILKFDERLYTLDVGGVHQYEVPKIIDPNDESSVKESVICYEPDRKQVIQLALIVWQVATKARNSEKPRTAMFEVAEKRCTATRDALKSLLLPFVDGDKSKAYDLCLTLLRMNKDNLDKYLKDWEIIPRPKSVWVDEKSNRIFLAQYEGRVLVGLSTTNCVFVCGKQDR